ncbi:jg20466 [Pararge aegeria aegeria]|uniref:Jg20466 protein n=1 Tax=Pararge aegeria aegeria TaxID=348720 RepID=A0A8S4QHH4_9NEOP|nr:jg20466 [Pararge aegeria aegeria]
MKFHKVTPASATRTGPAGQQVYFGINLFSLWETRVLEWIRQAKEAWYGDLCSVIEELDKKFDSFNMHKKIKDLIAPKHQGCSQTTLVNNDGNYTTCTNEILVTWEQYVKELFHDTRCDPVDFICKDAGPAITRSEVYHAIKTAKTRKAVGPDEIPVEIIKEIEEFNIDYLVKLFNAIYDSEDRFGLQRLPIHKNLYWNQSANIRVNRNLSSYIEIERGVIQGCILSPLLFNLYAEAIFSEALDNILDGISINGKTLNNIRYADDTILIADSLEGLQNIVNSVASAQWLTTKGIIVLKYAAEQARNAFSRLKRVFCDRNLSIALRTRIARCYEFSVLLYDVEALTLKETMSRKLEAFEMWVSRRMLKISWTDRVRNSTVLQRMGKVPEVLLTIKKRKLEYFGHVMRYKVEWQAEEGLAEEEYHGSKTYDNGLERALNHYLEQRCPR